MKVREARVLEFKNKIYADVDEFFNLIHQQVNYQHKDKIKEVDDVFRKLKIDDLSDMEKYSDLY